MTKKQITQLVQASYNKGELDEKTVDRVATSLTRRDLKAYVRKLKLEEKKKQVNIAVPSASIYNTSKQVIFDLFPGKHIHVSEDKLLMLGAKVTAGDMVYEYSLKQKLESFLDELADTYDEE